MHSYLLLGTHPLPREQDGLQRLAGADPGVSGDVSARSPTSQLAHLRHKRSDGRGSGGGRGVDNRPDQTQIINTYHLLNTLHICLLAISMHSPHDLYIAEGPAGNQVAHMLWTLGYKTVVMVTQVSLPPDESENVKHSKPNIPLPGKPIIWKHGLSPGMSLPRSDTPPRVLSRLHVTAEGLNHLHCLGAPEAKAYDVISVEPRSEKVT